MEESMDYAHTEFLAKDNRHHWHKRTKQHFFHHLSSSLSASTQTEHLGSAGRPSTLLLRAGKLRRPELHQGSYAIRIDADDDIARELVDLFPLVRRASWDDEDIALRKRDVLGPDRRRAAATPAVAGAHGTAIPIGNLPAKQHMPPAFEHVIDFRHVVVNGIVRVLLSLVAINDANANLMLVAPTAGFDHVYRNIINLGGDHVLLVRLDLGSLDEGRWQIIPMTGQHQR